MDLYSTIKVFAIAPRPRDPARYWKDALTVMRMSETIGLTGVLIFAGNDAAIDPFVVAQTLFRETTSLSPLVAVNPIYMHPYTVARLVASYAYLYERPTYLNMVTGASTRFLNALNDTIEHDERYARLSEYGKIIQSLVRPRGVTTIRGAHYSLTGASLTVRPPEHLQPQFIVAGESDAALTAARELGAKSMRMLRSGNAQRMAKPATGLHFGLITRATLDEARDAAAAHFPSEPGGDALGSALLFSDSEWKLRLKRAADLEGEGDPSFWLAPFRSGRADCPYIVASHADAAARIAEFVTAGADWFILDVPPEEADFENVRIAMDMARRTIEQTGRVA